MSPTGQPALGIFPCGAEGFLRLFCLKMEFTNETGFNFALNNDTYVFGTDDDQINSLELGLIFSEDVMQLGDGVYGFKGPENLLNRIEIRFR